MKCDIILPVWNQREVTANCIDSIIKGTKYPYRLIIIDNASDDDTRKYLESIRDTKGLDVLLIRNGENLGFVKAVNQGLRASSAPYVCVFNNDTIAAPGWLEEMAAFAERHKDIGMINPLCYCPSDIPIGEYARMIARSNKDRYMEMNQCFLFCALIKREVIERIGYLDEVFGVGCFDDTDYSMRAHIAGYRCVCLHSACVHHIEGVSFEAMGDRKAIAAECEKEYFKKWPRHLRAAVIYSISEDVPDADISNMLKAVLYLARQWSWVNLFIFGDKKRIGLRLDEISKRVDMPLHQNIKFNIFPERHKKLHALIRLVERSIGTKRRKMYDIVITDDPGCAKFLNAFRPVHGVNAELVDFGSDVTGNMASAVKNARKKR